MYLNTKQLVDILGISFQEYANVEYAYQMKKYMRNKFEFFGLQSKNRRAIQNQWLKEYGADLMSHSAVEIAKELFKREEREFQLAALDYLEKVKKKQLTIDDIPHIENFIVQKSWWDSVDLIANKIVGHLLKNEKKLQIHYIDKWINSENIWLQRTALLYQLKYKKDTDKPQLKHIISMLKYHDDFFIRKAIGWSLRELAKTDADYVVSLVSELQLEGLSKREALKNLKTTK